VDGGDNHKRNTVDVGALTDEQLVEYVTGLDEVTPVENELAHRLEIYVALFGDVNVPGS